MKKLMMITYVFPPIAYAGTYRTLRFCRYLPENGWQPLVVTIKKGEDLDNDDSLLRLIPHDVKIFRTITVDFWRWLQRRKKNNNKREAIQNNGQRKNQGGNVQHNLKLPWLSKVKNLVIELVTMPDHMVFWVPFAITTGFSLMLHNDVRVIYTSSPPHSEHIAGLVLSMLFRKPWVADFRDPMLDSSGYNPLNRFRRSMDQSLEKLIVRYADKVLIISNHYRKIMGDRYPLSAHKFITMPNGYDPGDFEDVRPQIFDKFTILYAGSFYAERSPRFFLDGFGAWFRKQTPETQKNVQVIFHGIMPAEVVGQIHEQGLQDVVMAPGIIQKEKLIPKFKGADVLLLIIGFDPESRGTVTSKIFEYMACHRPILALIPEGDAADILANYKEACVISSENVEALEEYLTQAYSTYLTKRTQTDKVPGEGDKEKDLHCSGFDARNQTWHLAQLFDEMSSQKK